MSHHTTAAQPLPNLLAYHCSISFITEILTCRVLSDGICGASERSVLHTGFHRVSALNSDLAMSCTVYTDGSIRGGVTEQAASPHETRCLVVAHCKGLRCQGS